MNDHEIIQKFNTTLDPELLYSLTKTAKQFFLQMSERVLQSNKGDKIKAQIVVDTLGINLEKYNAILDKGGFKIASVIERGKSGTGIIVEKDGVEYVAKTYDKIDKSRLKKEIEMQQRAAEEKISPAIVFFDLDNKIIVMEKLDETLAMRYLTEINQNNSCEIPSYMIVQLLRIYAVLNKLRINHKDPALSNFMYKGNELYIIDFSDSDVLEKNKYNTYTELYYRFLRLAVNNCRYGITSDDYNIENLEYKTIKQGDVFWRGTTTEQVNYDADKLNMDGVRWATPHIGVSRKYIKYNPKFIIQKLVAKTDIKVVNMSSDGIIKLFRYAYANKYEGLVILLVKSFLAAHYLVFAWNYDLNSSFEKNLARFELAPNRHANSNLTLDKFKPKRSSYVGIDRDLMIEICKLGFNGYFAPELVSLTPGQKFPSEIALCTTSKYLDVVKYIQMRSSYSKMTDSNLEAVFETETEPVKEEEYLIEDVNSEDEEDN